MKIFIAGGTSGIGLAVARKYLEQGHEVGVCGRSQEKIDAIEKHEKPRGESSYGDNIKRVLLH